MKLQLINDINTLKSTDNATQIELAVVDEQQQFIDLSQFEMILVNIGSGGALYSSETPVVNEDGNTFSFTLSNALPVGKYQIQVHLTTHDGKLHIAPHKGAETLTIEKSFNEIDGETIVVMTIQQLLDDMASTLRVAEESNTKADNAIAKADSAIDTANIATTDAATAITLASEAKSTVNDAVTSADNANAKSDTATNTANDALTVAQQAQVIAESADGKADTAISNASTANDTASNASDKADNALTTATDAKIIAEQVRAEFDSLNEGNTDAEMIAARTDEENVQHATLKVRIDSEATKRANGDANTLQSAKDYTDTKCIEVLQNAKSYTDGKIGTIDFSTLATKTEVENKVEKVDGKGLSTNDYTDAERCKTIYATSSTGASTVIKLAPISGFKLFTGAGVRIKFNNGNSVDEPQLNVNGTGAKSLKKVDGTPFSDIKTGGVYTFVYDGINYVAQSDSVQLTNVIDDSTTTAITPNAVKTALSNVSADTSSLQANIIDLAIELETSKNAELNGVNANIAIETFLTLDDVTMERGVHSATNKWIEV